MPPDGKAPHRLVGAARSSPLLARDCQCLAQAEVFEFRQDRDGGGLNADEDVAHGVRWESQLVQGRIHRQTEQGEDSNAERGADNNQNRRHLDAIWHEMKESSCGAPKGNPE